MRRRRPAVVIALILLALGGCADAPARGGGDGGPLPVPLRGAGTVSPEQTRALHEAEERAVTSCMLRRGLPYRPVPARRPTGGTDNPYGLLTGRDAAAHGYGISATALAGAAEDPNEPLPATWDAERRAAWHRALTGSGRHHRTLTAPGAASLRINTDGCVYAARTALYGSAWEQAELTVAGLAAQVVARVTADRAFLAAQQDWAACMRDAGERVSTLQQARGVIQDAVERAAPRAPLRAVGRREVEIARRDARCQSESGLAGATRTAQERVEAALPDSARQATATLLSLRAAALDRASR
ncbi:hypothetical protein [Streptomyces ficellus]|uniref:Uncharacterized protein n=1 Tax=Streptomyces ficellus TaxID=1977088 RepID=A0A6I6FWJ4_9ACTN|nr:hypothetical protein [Streptomyces ficellus]QGV82276.1 hypothetical protein EIZ62_31480 [Streptomyces ficellus]